MNEEKIRTRHLKYFSQLAEEAETALRRPEQIAWHTRLHDERDNIRAALEWADKTDVETGLHLAGCLQDFWESVDVIEGVDWLATFLNKPESRNYSRARAKALYTKAMLLWWMQEASLAQLAAHESLDLYRSCGDVSGEIDALLMLAVSNDKNQESEIIKLFQQALELANFRGDQWRQAHILGFLAFHGDYPRRISYTHEAIVLYKKAGDLESSIDQMISLAELELQCGNLSSAQRWLLEAVTTSQDFSPVETKTEASNFDVINVLSRRLRNKSRLAYALLVHGRIASLLGNVEEAYRNFHTCIEMSQELGNRLVYLYGRTHLGYLLLEQDNITEAHAIFSDSAENFQKDRNLIGVAFALEGIARILIMRGKPAHAARLIGWSDGGREKASDIRPPLEQADVDKTITACLAQMGEVAFSDAYEEGKKMSLEEAIAYALEESS